MERMLLPLFPPNIKQNNTIKTITNDGLSLDKFLIEQRHTRQNFGATDRAFLNLFLGKKKQQREKREGKEVSQQFWVVKQKQKQKQEEEEKVSAYREQRFFPTAIADAQVATGQQKHSLLLLEANHALELFRHVAVVHGDRERCRGESCGRGRSGESGTTYRCCRHRRWFRRPWRGNDSSCYIGGDISGSSGSNVDVDRRRNLDLRQ